MNAYTTKITGFKERQNQGSIKPLLPIDGIPNRRRAPPSQQNLQLGDVLFPECKAFRLTDHQVGAIMMAQENASMSWTHEGNE